MDEKDVARATGGESLNADEILTAEFNYIAQTAFQANEDRARVTNFYLVTIGSFVAAVFGLQVEAFQVAQVYASFGILFAVLSAAGLLTLLQLVRLREAWFESAGAMNRLKRYYIARVERRDLAEAFAWMTLPPRYKPRSIAHMLAVQVALLAGVASGASLIFFGLALGRWLLLPAFLLGIVAIYGQMRYYRTRLERSERQAAAMMAMQAGQEGDDATR